MLLCQSPDTGGVTASKKAKSFETSLPPSEDPSTELSALFRVVPRLAVLAPRGDRTTKNAFPLTSEGTSPIVPSLPEGTHAGVSRSRSPPRHPRRHDPQGSLLGADARIRRREMDSSHHRRRPPDRGQRTVSRAPPYGAPRLDHGGMGTDREQSPGEVLQAHS